MRGPKSAWVVAAGSSDGEAAAALEGLGLRVISLDSDPAGRVDLPGLLEFLAAEGVRSLMVEGGAAVLGEFLRLRLADYLVVTIAPVFVGGLAVVEAPLAAVGELPAAAFELKEHFPTVKIDGFGRYGADLVAWGAMERR